MWTQGTSLTNSLRKRPAVSAPPPPPPEPSTDVPPMFLMSATGESMNLRYSTGKGSGHTSSSARAAASRTWSISASSLPITPAIRLPSAPTTAPVSVGEVDDRVDVLLDGEREAVGEHEPALGVGVEDFDRLAVANRDDVARLERGAARHVVGAAEEPDDLRSGLVAFSTLIVASTAAAPLMSIFIDIIPSPDFSERPPESNMIPLPTSTIDPDGLRGV